MSEWFSLTAFQGTPDWLYWVIPFTLEFLIYKLTRMHMCIKAQVQNCIISYPLFCAKSLLKTQKTSCTQWSTARLGTNLNEIMIPFQSCFQHNEYIWKHRLQNSCFYVQGPMHFRNDMGTWPNTYLNTEDARPNKTYENQNTGLGYVISALKTSVGISLGMRTTNERRRYNVTTSHRLGVYLDWSLHPPYSSIAHVLPCCCV